MPTNQELLDKWSARFTGLGISLDLLKEALLTRPEDAELDFMFLMCRVNNEKTKYTFRHAWELVMYSGHLAWVNEQLKTTPESTRNHVNETLAHFVALSRNVPCILAVLKKYPSLMNVSSNIGSVEKYAKEYNYPNTPLDFEAIKQELMRPRPPAETRQLIMAGEANWEKMLVELKSLADRRYENSVAVFTECVEYHIPRLKRLLKTEKQASALASLKLLSPDLYQAQLVLSEFNGQTALVEARQLIAAPIPTGFFFSNPKKDRENKVIELFNTAISLGIVAAHHDLGAYYLTHTFSVDRFEKGFGHYYHGSSLGEKYCFNALQNAAAKQKNSNPDDHFFGNLYLGLSLHDASYLSVAQQSNETEFLEFTLQHASDATIASKARLLLLRVNLEKDPRNVAILKSRTEVVRQELQLGNHRRKIEFAIEYGQCFGFAKLVDLALTYADDIEIPKEQRMALLVVAAKAELSTQNKKLIDAHLDALPDLKNSYTKIVETISFDPTKIIAHEPKPEQSQSTSTLSGGTTTYEESVSVSSNSANPFKQDDFESSNHSL